MKKEYDFSKGERGKFFRPDAELNIPVYLEPQIADAVREHARRRNTDISPLVNAWLRKDLRERQRLKVKTSVASFSNLRLPIFRQPTN